MSSSSSGQWTPSPRPINRHFLRSFFEACTRRGYQASGTEIERPSLRSTVSVSYVTARFVAAGTVISFSAEVILCLEEFLLMLSGALLDPRIVSTPEVAAQSQRRGPQAGPRC